jgi:hypothetical protein
MREAPGQKKGASCVHCRSNRPASKQPPCQRCSLSAQIVRRENLPRPRVRHIGAGLEQPALADFVQDALGRDPVQARFQTLLVRAGVEPEPGRFRDVAIEQLGVGELLQVIHRDYSSCQPFTVLLISRRPTSAGENPMVTSDGQTHWRSLPIIIDAPRWSIRRAAGVSLPRNGASLAGSCLPLATHARRIA